VCGRFPPPPTLCRAPALTCTLPLYRPSPISIPHRPLSNPDRPRHCRPPSFRRAQPRRRSALSSPACRRRPRNGHNTSAPWRCGARRPGGRGRHRPTRRCGTRRRRARPRGTSCNRRLTHQTGTLMRHRPRCLAADNRPREESAARRPTWYTCAPNHSLAGSSQQCTQLGSRHAPSS